MIEDIRIDLEELKKTGINGIIKLTDSKGGFAELVLS